MNDFSRHAYRQWYVAARSDELRGGARPVLLLGSNLALGRLASGELFALDDRCPHRGVPLSDGRLLPGGLACRHHGWTFNPAGYCIGVPGAPAEQVQDIRVAACATREHDGLVWVARTPAAPFPGRIEALDSAQRRDQWQAKARAPIIDVLAYAIETLHAAIVQPATGREPSEGRADEGRLQRSTDGFTIDYAPQQRRSPLLLRLLGSGNAGTALRFCAISVVQLEYQDQRGWRAWMTMCFSPETLVSTRIYTSLHVDTPSTPTWLARAALAPFLGALARHEGRLAPAPDLNRVPSHPLTRPYLEDAWRGPEQPSPGQGHPGTPP